MEHRAAMRNPGTTLPGLRERFALATIRATNHKRGHIMDKQTFEKGLEIRKTVLGREHVENALKSADEFSRPFQEFTTEYCWGAVWGREELPKKTRSLLNLAMLGVLNKEHELKLHIRGALRNGVSKEEIRGCSSNSRSMPGYRPRSSRSAARGRCSPSRRNGRRQPAVLGVPRGARPPQDDGRIFTPRSLRRHPEVRARRSWASLEGRRRPGTTRVETRRGP
jgi:4-carboxymuconolactone decarboxylase